MSPIVVVVITANEMRLMSGGGIEVMSGGVPMMGAPGSRVMAGQIGQVGLLLGTPLTGEVTSGGTLRVDGMTGHPVAVEAATTLHIQLGPEEVTGISQYRSKLKILDE